VSHSASTRGGVNTPTLGAVVVEVVCPVSLQEVGTGEGFGTDLQGCLDSDDRVCLHLRAGASENERVGG
jgi:hypothetical protein